MLTRREGPRAAVRNVILPARPCSAGLWGCAPPCGGGRSRGRSSQPVTSCPSHHARQVAIRHLQVLVAALPRLHVLLLRVWEKGGKRGARGCLAGAQSGGGVGGTACGAPQPAPWRQWAASPRGSRLPRPAAPATRGARTHGAPAAWCGWTARQRPRCRLQWWCCPTAGGMGGAAGHREGSQAERVRQCRTAG